ncbi:MAG: peptidoglycan bridge formation glycyltransferase FemA/FemB family protein [Chloroflexota bacterium]
MSELNAEEWDRFLEDYPNAHLLQTSAWGELKSSFGWVVSRLVVEGGGAQVLFRRLPLGLTFAYIPKGPVGENWDSLWSSLDDLCRTHRTAFLKVEPDCTEPHSGNWAGSPPSGFRISPHHIQPPRTLVVDLRPDEETILARMKQKTRYNIRVAQRKGVVVHHSDDVKMFHDMLQVTGERDEFGVHSLDYFLRLYKLFKPRGGCELLVAQYNHTPLAGLFVFTHGNRAWYLYGASNDLHRNRMPAYLLQWEAMRWAKAHGCWEYDLWGVPNVDEDVLEANFTHRSDGLWGVYRFKRGFGGELRRAVAAWDRVYSPMVYWLYAWWVKRGRGSING